MSSSPVEARITMLGETPGLDHQAVDVVVTLPTFKRPQMVLDTLASLRAQLTERRFAVIVMENEADQREGAAAALPLFESGEMPGMVIVAHERGNCSAYNAGWLTATRQFPNFRYLLVIDDDETGDPAWLETMCSAAERLQADIVGGPQLPVFADPKHRKWARHPVFSPHYQTTGRVNALYSSGNLLVTREVVETMGWPYFDPRFNFIGGGDSDLLSRAAQKGFVLGWCAEAIINETVPARRVEADWIRARSLRNGVISTMVEKRKRAGTPFAGLKVWAKSLALLGASPFRGAIKYIRTRSLSIALYPVYIAIGRVAAEFGYANEQYRQPEKN